MKSLLVRSTMLLAAASLLAADKDDVKSAAQKLAGADNYSWTTSVETSSQFKPGPSHGKTQKDGLVWMDMTMQDNTVEAFAKGGKGAIKTEDGWQPLDFSTNAGGGGGGGRNPARFMAGRLRNFKSPAVQAEDIAGKTKDLAKTADAYTGDLTEEGAKSLLTMGGGRRGGAGGPAPEISNAKGSAKFWVKEGVITKYQFKVTGTTKNRDGEDVDIDRTTTVEIKDVGTTTITLPDEAKNKMT
jgi:hypothetical protein